MAQESYYPSAKKDKEHLVKYMDKEESKRLAKLFCERVGVNQKFYGQIFGMLISTPQPPYDPDKPNESLWRWPVMEITRNLDETIVTNEGGVLTEFWPTQIFLNSQAHRLISSKTRGTLLHLAGQFTESANQGYRHSVIGVAKRTYHYDGLTEIHTKPIITIPGSIDQEAIENYQDEMNRIVTPDSPSIFSMAISAIRERIKK